MKLNTRRFFKTQEIDILKASLRVEKKSLLDSIEYEIPFENIHHKKKIQTVTNDNLLVISFILLVFGVLFKIGSNDEIGTIGLFSGTFFLALTLITRKSTIMIPTYDGNNLELPFNKANKQEVLEFSNKVIDASNQFLLRKYSKVDRALPIESQLGKLEFLRDRDIISDEEYEELKNQLLGRENQRALGFGR